MKNILFCVLVLLAVFRPANSFATDSKPTHKFKNIQGESPSRQEAVGRSVDYFYNDLLEADEDDTNDPDSENCFLRSPACETSYLASQDFYNSRFKQLLYTGYSFFQGSPVFIRLRVFRL